MDKLNWEATPIISSSWKNQQQQIKDSLMMSNLFRFPFKAFNPIQQQLGDDNSSQYRDIGDSSAMLAMNFQEFGSSFDPIHILSSWKISQRQEAATKLAADSVSAKSGTGSLIGDCTKMGSSSSFPPQNNHHNMMRYFGNNQLSVCGSNGFLSKIASNRDTSTEESAIDAFNSKPIDANESNNNIQYSVNEIDERVSNTSSYHPRNNLITSSEAKRYKMDKRSHDALLESDSSTRDNRFQQPKSKKSRSEYKLPSSSNINFHQASSWACSTDEPNSEVIAQMKEMIYRAAAFRPVSSVTEEEVMVEKPKRKNVRISTDPQTAAARRRRERISERIRALQKLVPGGNNMDTASMLDEAANYLKFLRTQVNAFESFGYITNNNFTYFSSIPFNYTFPIQHHLSPLDLNPIHHHNS